jgi:hypothetical protein
MNTITRIWLVLFLAIGLASGAESRKHPNILFILTDDMGWMDLVCQGNPNQPPISSSHDALEHLTQKENS